MLLQSPPSPWDRIYAALGIRFSGHSQQHAVARAGSEDTAVAVVLLKALKVAAALSSVSRRCTYKDPTPCEKIFSTGTLPAAYEHLSISPESSEPTA